LNLTQDTIWNAARAREMARPLTPVEQKKIRDGIPRETVMQESFWWMRSDGIAVLPPTGNKAGTFCILERKRLIRIAPCVLDQIHTGALFSVFSKSCKFFSDAAQDGTCPARAIVPSGHGTMARAMKKN
jgi:hypothetical protein